MKMSIGAKHLIKSIICGLLWLFAGIFELIHSKPALLLAAVLLFVSAALNIFVNLSTADSEDEMSELNQYKAKARTYNMILYGILFLLIFSSIQVIRGKEVTINLYGWLVLFIGIIQFIEGILFRLYEKGMDL